MIRHEETAALLEENEKEGGKRAVVLSARPLDQQNGLCLSIGKRGPRQTANDSNGGLAGVRTGLKDQRKKLKRRER